MRIVETPLVLDGAALAPSETASGTIGYNRCQLVIHAGVDGPAQPEAEARGCAGCRRDSDVSESEAFCIQGLGPGQ